MNTVNFYLWPPRDKDGKSSIYTKFTYKISRTKSLRLTYGTDLSVKPSQWDKKRQRAKESAIYSDPANKKLNADLDNLEHTIKEIYRKYRAERRTMELTTDHFKKQIDTYLWGEDPAFLDFFSFLDYHLEQYKNDPDYNLSTFKIFKRTKKLLTEYAEETGKFEFSDIDVLFMRRFVEWLRSYPSKSGGIGYADNTIIKIIGSFRAYLEAAVKEGVTQNRSFRDASKKVLKLKKTQGDKIYLTIAELKHFYSYPYTRPALKRVVDIFTAASLLGGLRVSDWDEIKKEGNFYTKDGVTLFNCVTKKTDQPITVPVHPIVMEILDRYEGDLLKISDQKSNKYLKLAAEESGFTQARKKKVMKKTFVEMVKPMYQLFTCHVARNNFNSNALEAGIPDRDVKRFMGHKDRGDMTANYDRRGDERLALSYADHPFFNDW